MITSKEHDKLCDLVLEYQKTLIDLHTATRQELVTAAYEFGHAVPALFGYILELTEQTSGAAEAWITWGGGECPVRRDTLIVAKFRDGCINARPSPASTYQWSHVDEDWDVVAYRIVE